AAAAGICCSLVLMSFKTLSCASSRSRIFFCVSLISERSEAWAGVSDAKAVRASIPGSQRGFMSFESPLVVYDELNISVRPRRIQLPQEDYGPSPHSSRLLHDSRRPLEPAASTRHTLPLVPGAL